MSRKNTKTVEIPSLEVIEAERRRYKYKRKYNRTFTSTVSVLIVTAAIAILISMLWVPVLRIYGQSMSPTLEDGEIVVSVKGSKFETGELAAFYYGNKLLIKRVIAGPGDWVNIDASGNVFVNGEALNEPYVTQKALGESDIEYPYQVPDERWFLMGDNRTVSVDSRSTQVGCVSNEQIVGRIIFRIWPLSLAGTI